MDTSVILNYLATVTNKYLVLHVIMHVLIYSSIPLVCLPVFRIKRLVFDGLNAFLVSAVAIIAIINGNPFIFLTFALVAFYAIIEVFKGRNEVTAPAMSPKNIVLFAFVGLGVWYPHFVNASPALMVLFSPVGIIPCPTLITVLGMLNIICPKVNKGLYAVTGIMGLFYGITGVFLMKVYLDIPLILISVYSAYNMRFLFGKKALKRKINAVNSGTPIPGGGQNG